MIRSSNPALKNEAFQASQTWDDVYGPGGAPAAAVPVRPDSMTVIGVVQKASFLIGLTVMAAVGGWYLTLPESVGGMGILSPLVAMIGTLVIGFPLLLIAGFKPKLSPFLAPPFAVVEGLFAGSFSAVVAYMMGQREDGIVAELNHAIVFNALVLTMAIFAGMLVGYGTKIIRPGKVFYAVVGSATLGVFIYTLLAMGLHFTGISSSLAGVYSIDNGGLISIGFSVFIVVLASLNLVMDFDQISLGARNGAPKYMEWYGSMALLVTLVWLYVEVLRLIAKLQSRE